MTTAESSGATDSDPNADLDDYDVGLEEPVIDGPAPVTTEDIVRDSQEGIVPGVPPTPLPGDAISGEPLIATVEDE